MNISSIGLTSMMPSVSNISKDIISQTDTDSDSALSLEELGIDEELFNTLDSDSDGYATQAELSSAIESKLSEYGGSMPSPEEFSSLLSDLGLEIPEPPEKPSNNTDSMSGDFAAELMSAYDTDGDSLLTSEEVSLLSQEEFSSLDTDSDGSISTEELTSAINKVASGTTPPPAGGAPMGGGESSASSESEDEETYSEIDTNEDGVISREELEAYYGISNNSSEDESTETANDNSLQNIKMLMEALKSNSDDPIDQDSFSGMMKIINTQNNNSELNSYLSKSTSSSLFSYV
ncbi:EF-hand domain-containing protein [Arcobacter arenosus]|uniref:EF-hand domain-containing protein n=1 Tax=Arcobacter arenosus TaxID=2576037 RepID=A0A5R8XXZ1_9BACT|nr:EF-hand domain-containing protein [Arcobacter arenosus]TLP35866.1 hypothetical protein FDK22_14535 [Arcobacter arenosus]